MTAWLLMATALAAQSPEQARWTWTLYDSHGARVVLANEIPDTPSLRATLECDPGSGAVLVSVYDREGVEAGYISIRSGQASTASQGELFQDGGSTRLTASMRTEHPVFTAFLETRALTLHQGENRWTVRVGARYGALLTDFAAACGG
ncbi:MAG: hypothetical protein ACK4FB_01730 [Brevundimonas sp.]|uniref:hypothetical protein n=1 Tax=Brevundimonas sp. TaxID=1871086 RepID=UPI00391C9549